MPKVLGDRADVFLYGTNIYIPKKDFCYKIKNYLDIFSEGKVIKIDKCEEERVFRKLIPSLRDLTENVVLSKNIMNKTVLEPVKFNFTLIKRGKK